MTTASREQFETIWMKASKSYEDVAHKRLEDAPKIETVDQLIESLNERNRHWDQWRDKSSLMHQLLRGALCPIELTARFAAGPASMAFPPSSMCFGAVTYLVDAARKVSADLDRISGMMATLKDFLVRLNIYNRDSLSTEMQVQLADILTLLLKIFAEATHVVKHNLWSRAKSFGTNVLLGSNKELQSMTEDLQTLTEREVQLAGAETHLTVRQTQTTVGQISGIVGDSHKAIQEGNVKTDLLSHQMNQGFASVTRIMSERKIDENRDQTIRQHEHAKKLFEGSPDSGTKYRNINRTRVSGTGDWLQTEPAFQGWLEGRDTVLYMAGMPGAGKSFLCGSTIRYLQNDYIDRGTHPFERLIVSYYFFKDNDARTQSFREALKSLALQISEKDAVFLRHLEMISKSEISTTESAWQKLFVDYYASQNSSGVFLILDGMDEAEREDLEDFARLLGDARNCTHYGYPKIRIAMFGRPDIIPKLEDGLGNFTSIELSPAKVSADIHQYIVYSTEKTRVLRKSKAELKEFVVNTMLDQAGGMFVWVDLMIQQISNMKRPDRIRECLAKAPTELHAMIEHVIERLCVDLTQEDLASLNEIIRWVAVANRPLSLKELDAVLKSRDVENILLEDDLRTRYASLFLVARADGLTTADLQSKLPLQPRDYLDVDVDEYVGGRDDIDQPMGFNSDPSLTTVSFCHASIGDYFKDLQQDRVVTQSSPVSGVDIFASRVSVFNTCLDLLISSEDPGIDESTMVLRLYAQHEWLSHLQDLSKDIPKLPHEKQVEIMSKLTRVFRDPNKTSVSVSKIELDEIIEETTVEEIMKWMRLDPAAVTADADDREWLADVQHHPQKILDAWLSCLSRRWLRAQDKYHHSAAAQMVCILAVLHGKVKPSGTSDYSLDQVMEAARWAQYDEDAQWHQRVGDMLRTCEYEGEAARHYELAIEESPADAARTWRSREGLARLKQKQGKNEEAMAMFLVCERDILSCIQAEKDSLKGNDQCDTSDTPILTRLGWVRGRLARICQDKLQLKEAANHYKRAIEADVEGVDYYKGYMKALVDDEQYVAVMDLIVTLQKRSADARFTKFQRVLDQEGTDPAIHSSIAISACRTDQVDSTIQYYREAMSGFRKLGYFFETGIIQHALATLEEKCERQRDALDTWHVLIVSIGKASANEASNKFGIMFPRSEVAEIYGLKCLHRALKYGKNTREALEAVRALEMLCTKRVGIYGAAPVIETNLAAGYLGVWYRTIGDKEMCQLYLRPCVVECIDMLSDDDPRNDHHALLSLSHALLAAGDDEKALAAARATRAYLSNRRISQESKDHAALSNINSSGQSKTGSEVADGIDSKTDQDRSLDNDSSIGATTPSIQESNLMQRRLERWACDGQHKDWRSFLVDEPVYLCRMCWSELCSDCVEGVKAKTMTEACDSSHRWVQVSSLTAEQRTLLSDHTKLIVGGKVVSLEEFKEDLRKEWRLAS